MWRCIHCLLHVTDVSTLKGSGRRCAGHNETWVDLASDSKNHDLFAAEYDDGSGIVMLCKKCGAWACDKFKLLNGSCLNTLPKHRRYDRDLLLSGKHPKRKGVMVGPFARFAVS